MTHQPHAILDRYDEIVCELYSLVRDGYDDNHSDICSTLCKLSTDNLAVKAIALELAMGKVGLKLTGARPILYASSERFIYAASELLVSTLSTDR